MSKRKQSVVTVLDTSLNVLKSFGPFADDSSRSFVDDDLDKTAIARAWKQLEKDGYVYSEETITDPHKKSVRYFITFDGLLAIENCPFFLQGKPYRWKVVKTNLNLFWKVICIMAVILNAIIILIFTYLTYIKPS